VDFLKRCEAGSWPLGAMAGQTNSVLVIRVDDSAEERVLRAAALTREGQLID
jgi:hypothetical protein